MRPATIGAVESPIGLLPGGRSSELYTLPTSSTPRAMPFVVATPGASGASVATMRAPSNSSHRRGLSIITLESPLIRHTGRAVGYSPGPWPRRPICSTVPLRRSATAIRASRESVTMTRPSSSSRAHKRKLNSSGNEAVAGANATRGTCCAPVATGVKLHNERTTPASDRRRHVMDGSRDTVDRFVTNGSEC
jgi:hypothetical protein